MGFTDLRSTRADLKPGQKLWKVLILWVESCLQSCPCSSRSGTSDGEGTCSPLGNRDEFHAGDLQAKKTHHEETAKQADDRKKCRLIHSEIFDFFLLKNPQQRFLILGKHVLVQHRAARLSAGPGWQRRQKHRCGRGGRAGNSGRTVGQTSPVPALTLPPGEERGVYWRKPEQSEEKLLLFIFSKNKCQINFGFV